MGYGCLLCDGNLVTKLASVLLWSPVATVFAYKWPLNFSLRNFIPEHELRIWYEAMYYLWCNCMHASRN
jgi:hypothetical protein